MSNIKNVIGTCIFAVILTEVTTWTIDLPEVRRYFFERNEHKHGDENKIYLNRRPELVNYNNIEGDSLHNAPERGVYSGRYDANGIYADHYGYLTYMEKKVHGVLDKGSVYLEGLRRAMERYSAQLENCTKLERSRPQTNISWAPEVESPLQPLSAEEATRLSCEKATHESEHVRRLASLVTWVIRELQDIAYAKDYDKETKQSEEDALLLQLAWALDQLARLTGFEPDAAAFTTHSTPAPAPSTTPLTYFNLPVPNDGPTMVNCIKDPAAAPGVPATVRCAVPIPAVVLQFLNLTDAPASATANSSQTQDMMRLIDMFNNSSSGAGQQTFSELSAEQVRERMRGCLAGGAADEDTCFAFQAFLQFLNNLPQQQIPQSDRLPPNLEDSQLELLQQAAQGPAVPPRRRRTSKRSVNGPLKEFATYYGKYKAWTNSNPGTPDLPASGGKTDSYDVDNHLTAVKSVQKRSNANVGDALRAETRTYLEKIFRGNVIKRSIYERKLHRPRVPEDPMQDISYYVKSKAGTRARADAARAARVRLGLQEVFERGALPVVRRYGSNFVPGVRPLTAGAVESFSDI